MAKSEEKIAALENKMTEAGLEDYEKYLIRQHAGLPVGEKPQRLEMYSGEMGEAHLRRILMRALTKLNRPDPAKEEARLAELNKNPQVLKALELVEEVGLNHSGVMGGTVIIEGGIKDPLKACKVPGFNDVITGGTDRINRDIAQRNLLPARRSLLAHVVSKLQELGASLNERNLHHADTVDETYELIFDGRKVGLILMPR